MKLKLFVIFTFFYFSLFSLTIAEIQESVNGDSPYINQEVTFIGIVTAKGYMNNDNNFFVQDPSGGNWSGILVYNSPTSVNVGDKVEVTGTVIEYYNFTEISNPNLSVNIISSNNPLPEPLSISTLALNNEMYESVLVEVNDVTITSELTNYNEFNIDDGSGSCQVDDSIFFPSELDLSVGSTFNKIIGIVGYSFNSFELLPRNLQDYVQEGFLKADFNVNISNGISPLTVEFKNTSLGEIDSYAWDFNNDNQTDSEEENPDWIFTEPGYHSVSLTVYSGENSNTKTINNLINVLQNGDDLSFRVMSYNTLFFGDNSEERSDYFKTVVSHIQPDLMLLQEISNNGGAELFLRNMQEIDNSYFGVPYINGPGGPDCWMIYKTNKINFSKKQIITTNERNIMHYQCLIGGHQFNFFSCHLKAGIDNENVLKRKEEIQFLLDYITENNITNLIIGGDMNLYTNEEPAYQLLTTFVQDLSPFVGNWHNNPAFTSVHTQATRNTQFGGGSYGGLDDRFDFIFTSLELMEAEYYIENSFNVVGQDSQHFNDSVNDGNNNSVPENVANALYFASDHLPIYTDFTVTINSEDEIIKPMENIKIFPNPINYKYRNGFNINFYLKENDQINIDLYNIKGQLVKNLNKSELNKGEKNLTFKIPENLSTGIYFIKIKGNHFEKNTKILLLK